MRPLVNTLSLLSLSLLACGVNTRPIPRREGVAPSAETTQAAPATVARKNPFDGAPPYAALLPDARATTMHTNAKVGVIPDLKQKCLTCHGAGGDAPRFLFGGSIYQAKDATAGAVDMEIGVVDSKGKDILVHSDQDGNFWAMGTQTMTYPAFAAVRLGATMKPMKRKVTDATEMECNSCHDASNPILKP